MGSDPQRGVRNPRRGHAERVTAQVRSRKGVDSRRASQPQHGRLLIRLRRITGRRFAEGEFESCPRSQTIHGGPTRAAVCFSGAVRNATGRLQSALICVICGFLTHPQIAQIDADGGIPAAPQRRPFVYRDGPERPLIRANCHWARRTQERSASLTLRARSRGEKGFWMKLTPSSRTPWWAMTLAV